MGIRAVRPEANQHRNPILIHNFCLAIRKVGQRLAIKEDYARKK